MFNFLSAPKNITRQLTEQETGFILSLQQLLRAYQLRSAFTFFTGDVVINGVDRTALKAIVVQDLIDEIKTNGWENIPTVFVASINNHGLDRNNFLAGNTKNFLNNDTLFGLLIPSLVSTAILTTGEYRGATVPVSNLSPTNSIK